MKRMKILTCTLAALAMVMSTYIPARAEFFGTFQSNQPWILQLANASNRGEIAATVSYLAGKKLEFEALPLVPAATTSTFEMKPIPKNVTRIIIEVDLPANNLVADEGFIDVTQGAHEFGSLMDSRSGNRFVLEVAP